MTRESREKSRMPRPEQKMNDKDAKARRFKAQKAKTPEKIQGTSAKSQAFSPLTEGPEKQQ